MQSLRYLTTLTAWSILSFLLCDPHCHAADFFVSVEGQATVDGTNGFRYVYTISNSIDSTVSAYAWSLLVSHDTDASDFGVPEEWSDSYFSGDYIIIWQCLDVYSSEPSYVILPGESRTFSFLSPLAPGQTTYNVTGLGAFGEDDPMLSGAVIGPMQIVPEPSSLTLVCIGTIAVVASRGCSLRRWFRDSLAKVKAADSCS